MPSRACSNWVTASPAGRGSGLKSQAVFSDGGGGNVMKPEHYPELDAVIPVGGVEGGALEALEAGAHIVEAEAAGTDELRFLRDVDTPDDYDAAKRDAKGATHGVPPFALMTLAMLWFMVT